MDRSQILSQPRSARVFIGRRPALEALMAAAADAADGRGCMVLVSGEPGIGKTRLAEELSRRVGAMDVIWGLCSSGGGEPAYWPWTQVLRQCVQRCAAGAPPLPAELVAAVEPLLASGAGPRRPATLSAAIGTVSSADPLRLALFDAVAQLLERAAARGPLCLVFDDLHAADEASLRLAHFVARRLRQLPILVVGTHREAEVREQPAIAAVFADLVRESQGLALRVFDDDEVRRLVEAVGAAPATPELIARLQAATGGNPFFLDEVVRQLARDGGSGNAVDAAILVPERARAVIRVRIERLAMHDLEVLEVAAITGPRFEPAILAAVLERPPAWVLDRASALERDGLITPVPDASGHWEFRHDLVRSAVESDLSAERRARLHDAIATAVEAAFAADLDAVRSALAWHAFASLPVGAASRALEHCRLAGERAIRLLAYEEAVVHFERALAVAAQLEREDDTLRCDLLLSLGEVAFRAGDTGRSGAAFDEVVERARGDGVRLGRALLGCYFGSVGAGAVDRRRGGLIEEALAWLPAEPSALRAQLLARLAWELHWTSEGERRQALCAQAVDMARALDDPATLAYTLGVVRFVVWSRSNDEFRLGAASEIIRLAEQANDPVLAMEGHHWRVFDLLEQGDMAGVDREIEAHDRRARRFDIPHYKWWTALWRAMQALLAGRFADAERLIGAALERGSEVHPGNAAAAAGGQMFSLLLELGREDALASLLGVHDSIELWATVDAEVAAGFAWVTAEIGRLDEARQRLDRFVRDGIPTGMAASAWMPSMASLAGAAATVGETGLCRSLYDILLPWAEQIVVVGPALASFGPVARFLGTMAAVLDRLDDAERHLLAALELSRRMPAPPFIARTLHDLGALYLRRDGAGDRERARAVLGDALEAAERLGMLRVAARSRDMLAQCDTPAAAPASTPPAVSENTWRRDGEYWALTYDGTTVHVRDSIGVRCLARLLAAPNVEQPALVLVGEISQTEILVASDTGPRIDARARAEYGRRLGELEAEREDAVGAADLGRAERAAAEIEQIEDELSRVLGLGGRVRRDGSPLERARQNVTKAIKKALARIDAVHPSLGAHLTRAVRTGTQCVYVVEPRAGIRWVVSDGPRG